MVCVCVCERVCVWAAQVVGASERLYPGPKRGGSDSDSDGSSDSSEGGGGKVGVGGVY